MQRSGSGFHRADSPGAGHNVQLEIDLQGGEEPFTVVMVSGGSEAVGGGSTADVSCGAVAVAGGRLCAGVPTVADTDPLSPPPRTTSVQITATRRVAPATPAINLQRLSMSVA